MLLSWPPCRSTASRTMIQPSGGKPHGLPSRGPPALGKKANTDVTPSPANATLAFFSGAL
eukprot:6606488-Prorocentrum_lima.AAC.1